MLSLQRAVLVLFVAAVFSSARADDVLFIGNSFTYGEMAPLVKRNGGVPKLFEEIARAKGRQIVASSVTAPGMGWDYHLAQPATAATLGARTRSWVVLQDASLRPTHVGEVEQFMRDGEVFSERIASSSPHAGILLYETWARPPGAFYDSAPGRDFSGPGQMMDELHHSYAQLRDDLAAKNPDRPVRVARVGTAFARVTAEYPAIELNASDRHHATAEGYYLAALVIYEAIYHESVKGAPTEFFHGVVVIPAGDAAKLQRVADEVSGAAK